MHCALWATTLNRAPQVVRDLAARHHAELLLPHGAHGIERGAEQSLCARAKSALESTGATMIICDLPIEVVEVSVCSSCMGRVQIAPGGEGEGSGRGIQHQLARAGRGSDPGGHTAAASTMIWLQLDANLCLPPPLLSANKLVRLT